MNGLQTQPLKSMPKLENAHTLHGFLLGVFLGHVMQAEKQFRALVPEAEAITPFSHYGILVHILGGGTKHRTIQIQVMSHGSHGSMNITVIPPIGNGHPVINEGRRCAGRAANAVLRLPKATILVMYMQEKICTVILSA